MLHCEQKGISLNSVSTGIIKCFAVSKVTTCLNAVFRTQLHNHFATCVLFEVSPEIRCSGVSSRYCCYGNHTAGSKPILKLFIVVNEELNKVSLYQKKLVNIVNW